jgi:hypothetical protein
MECIWSRSIPVNAELDRSIRRRALEPPRTILKRESCRCLHFIWDTEESASVRRLPNKKTRNSFTLIGICELPLNKPQTVAHAPNRSSLRDWRQLFEHYFKEKVLLRLYLWSVLPLKASTKSECSAIPGGVERPAQGGRASAIHQVKVTIRRDADAARSLATSVRPPTESMHTPACHCAVRS